MKKAGIVTLFGEYNFGNRLQNYAVQEVLRKMELEVETIKYMPRNNNQPVIQNQIDENRLAKFKNFNEYIKFADEILYVDNEMLRSANKYDYIILGSDQIWNYHFEKFFSDKIFGSFVPKEKRISFSASFGINSIPKENEKLYCTYQKYLEDLKAISVREEVGKEIVESLTNRNDVEVLIDPTMMLETLEWEKVMKKPQNLKTNKFILKSFLGNISGEIGEELNRIAKENDCEIVDISNKDSEFYDVGPAEFIYLEKNAFLVVTDSFHSCVFSILFSTPFMIFERQDELASMYSRIETLLEKFKLHHRIFNGKITQEVFSNDYSKAYEILQSEREKVYKFLEKALG